MPRRCVLGPSEIAELRYLRECGFTHHELARCFSVHHTSVCVYLRRMGDPLGGAVRRVNWRYWQWKPTA